MSAQSELVRVVQQLSCCENLDSVVIVLREAARSLTGADGVTVVFREGDLCYYADENAIAPLWKGRRFPMKICVSGWCMLNRQPVVIPDIYADERVPQDAYRPTFVKSMAMVPIRSEDPIGAIGAYWATNHTATEAELQMMKALGDSASVAAANIQLIDSLREANRSKDEFLSMLAHELRNPLAPIQNALHILQFQSDEETVARAREMMQRQIRHLSQIVNDLLEVSRLTRGKITIRPERLDLTRVVRQSTEDRRSLIENAGLTLNLDLPATPIWVSGDATRLEQVLGNLLHNAVKFTPAGGRVAVQLVSENGDAVITVRDSGIGIEPKMLHRVFDVFAQADRSLDRSRGGLGIGLSVTKALLDLHHARIEAKSDGPGRGAEFVIHIARVAELPALVRRKIKRKTNGKSIRVLVVEDNRDSAESLRMLLELHGHEVTVAHTGREGVRAAEAVRPEVLLCDLGLPDMDGFAVATALRKNPITAIARFVAVTGYSTVEDQERTRQAGFDLHLVKPVDPDKLLEHLAIPTTA
jgi:signal transduction histidine kinase/CheY-like chemotaxis protein